MRTRRFNQIDLPFAFKEYYTKYPHGMTIFEALVEWVNTVNDMVENINDLNGYMQDFINQWQGEMREEVIRTLQEWQNDGTLEDIINEALTTRLDDVEVDLLDLQDEATGLKNRVDILETYSKNVLDYGAKGDGVVDDSQAIQNALDGGGRVFVPPGNYYIGSSVDIPSHTNLIGVPGTHIIVEQGVKAFTVTSGVHVSVEGFKVTQKGPGAGFISIMSGSSRISLKKIFSEGVDYPIDIDYSWIIDIKALRVQGCVVGVRASPQANAVSIVDSVINNATEFGATFKNSEGVNFFNTAFHLCFVAINLSNYARAVNIIGCYFEANIAQNILINASRVESRGINIQGNHIEQVSGRGSKTDVDIYIRFSDGVTIVGNEFKSINNPQHEYRVLMYDVSPSPSKNITIFGNYIPTNKGIASTTNYENQETFPTEYHTQPYGFN